MSRLKNKLFAKLFTRFPFLGESAAKGVEVTTAGTSSESGIPWTTFSKKLTEAKVAIVTTAGVHIKSDEPFNMQDEDGDPTYRVIPGATPNEELTITHDYYDHADADKDINIVFPLQRLREFAGEGVIGSVSANHYGFMGHIKGAHVDTLVYKMAARVAESLRKDEVDAVILTPG